MYISSSTPYLNALLRESPNESDKLPCIDVTRLLELSEEDGITYLKKLKLPANVELAGILYEVASNSHFSLTRRAKTLETIFKNLNSEDTERALLHLIAHLDYFLKIIDVYAGNFKESSQIRRVLSGVIDHSQCRFSVIESLANGALTIIRAQTGFSKKQDQLHSLLQMIDYQYLPGVAEAVINNLNSKRDDKKEIVDFFVLLSSKNITNKKCQIFVNAWNTSNENNLEAYQKIIPLLIEGAINHHVYVSVPLKHLLSTEQASRILRESGVFRNFCQDQIAYLLCHVPSATQKIVVQRFVTTETAVNILRGALINDKRVKQRKAMVSALTQSLNEDQFWNFLGEFCLKKNSQQLIACLFLDDSVCEKFLRSPKDNTKALLRTKILNGICRTNDVAAEQQVIKTLVSKGVVKKLLNEATLWLAPSDEPATFCTIKENANALLDALEVRGNEIGRITYLESVPPILLAFGLNDPDFRPTIFRCFKYLTEPQRLAVIKTGCADGSYQIIEELLQFVELSDIQKSISAEKISNYYNEKAQEIRIVRAIFKERSNKYQQVFQPYMTTPEELWKKPTPEEFAFLNEQFAYLTNFFRKFETAHYVQLYRFASQNVELGKGQAHYASAYEVNTKIYKDFTSQSYGKILARLEEKFPDLKSRLEEESPFPEYFYSLLTLGVQKDLKLGPLPYEALAAAGIQSADDLEILGYHPEKDQALKSMSLYLLDSISRESPLGVPNQALANECLDEWAQIFKNPFKNSFHQEVLAFIKQSQILQREPHILHAKVKGLISHLEKIASFRDGEGIKLRIEKIKKRLNLGIEHEHFLKACKQCLILVMRAYRKQIIPMLGGYLLQKNLQKCWQLLKGEGYANLKSLDDMGLIEFRQSLLDMQTLCKKLFPNVDFNS